MNESGRETDDVVVLNTEVPPDRLERRARIVTTPNPNRDIDYLTRLDRPLSGEELSIAVSYVPDKWLLDPKGFDAYLATLAPRAWDTLQALALAVLDDINNEVVPRWVQVKVDETCADGARTEIIVEDRQPRWDNPALLSRNCS